jgi:hypothetical protein
MDLKLPVTSVGGPVGGLNPHTATCGNVLVAIRCRASRHVYERELLVDAGMGRLQYQSHSRARIKEEFAAVYAASRTACRATLAAAAPIWAQFPIGGQSGVELRRRFRIVSGNDQSAVFNGV